MLPSSNPTTIDRISQLESIGDVTQDFSNRERLMRWQCAWRMAMDRPLFGHGPGCYPLVFRHYLRGWGEADRISYWFGWRLGAHSDAITTLAETGFPGAIAFVGMLLLAGRVAMRELSATGRGMTLHGAMFLGLIGWVVHGCFNDLLSNGCLTVWAFFMVGALLRNGFVNESPPSPPSD